MEAETGGIPPRGVEFLRHGVRIGLAESAPFRVTWKGPEPGSYVLTARALDERGVSATSDPTMVTVVVVDSTRDASAKYLSDLPWTSATSGWGPVERDLSNGEQGTATAARSAWPGETIARDWGSTRIRD